MQTGLGSHHLGGHGWLRLVVVTALILIIILELEAGPAAAASRKACHIRNADTGRTYQRLQQAVDAAKPGARLIVTGRCMGGTFIDKSIGIVGKKTKRSGKPILDGDGKARVLSIKPKVTVDVRSLVIRNGRASRVREGGGISNKGKTTLRDVVVRNNTATRGGGIFNAGVLRLLARSIVRGNTQTGRAPLLASGIYNTGRAVLDDEARVHNNEGTVAAVNEGYLSMRGASRFDSNNPFHGPSGIVMNRGTMVMDETASVSRQGGVSNAGSLVMNGASSIHDNSTSGCVATICGPAGRPGAGVNNTGSLTLNDTASIHHNRVFGAQQPDARARGGGVYNQGSVTMTGASRIQENEAQPGENGVPGLGGGLYNAAGGTLNGVSCAPQTAANIVLNAPDDCFFE